MTSTQLDVIAPDFTAKDSEGSDVRLSDYKGKKNVVLVFNRGFNDRTAGRTWRSCARTTRILPTGARARLIVAPENAEDFAAYWHSRDMPFTGIPDPRHSIAGLYGQQVVILKFGRMPAMFVIDKEGKIRFRHYGNSMSDISNRTRISCLCWMQ